MMVTSGTMTNRIDQLEKDGFVERVPNTENKRSVRVQLTESGITKIDAAVSDYVVVQKRLVEGLFERGQSELNTILDKCLSSLGDR